MPREVRLFVDAELAAGSTLSLDAQAHYLAVVMRLGPGDTVTVFNGRQGAWAAEIVAATKRRVSLEVQSVVAPQRNPPDLWLLFAPIKKARTDFIVEKAAELGVQRILPVFTEHTNAERLRADRLRAHAIEAAEQCGGTFVPEVAEARALSACLAAWPKTRRLLFCDERGAAPPVARALSDAVAGPWAILIGPEGGFSAAEARMLTARAEVLPVSLGPRILRADTAAIAALTAWQMVLGDWTEARDGAA
ncbi:MAG: 16S rRNA (uracil(1498)-N(3))-methyltransferase [Pseudomonadota bacterium]